MMIHTHVLSLAAGRVLWSAPAKQPKLVKHGSRVCPHKELLVSLLTDQLLCLENTVSTGSVKLIPDTQIGILKRVAYPFLKAMESEVVT